MRTLKAILVLAVATLVAANQLQAGAKVVTPATAAAEITTARAFASVEELASPRYAGRLTGTPGFDAAAAWAAEQFRRAGLRPPAGMDGFLQPFPVRVGRPESVTVELLPTDEAGKTRRLEFFKDVAPYRLTGFGDVTAEVVFVGYGITAPELGRDDYSHVDVAGKIVMLVRGSPRDGRDWRAHTTHAARVTNARAHGAAGYLFAEGAGAHVGGEHIPDLPQAGVSEEIANLILEGPKLKLEELRKVLGLGGVVSVATGRRVHIAAAGQAPLHAMGHNVIGVLPGKDARECVVVGAHLDHTGDWPELLPGADDNASGAAVVLEMARAAARVQPRPQRSIVFVLFGGEEMGLLGARHLAAQAPPGLGTIVAVLNFDMVGAGSGMFVLGGENSPGVWEPIVRARDLVAPGVALRRGRSEGEARADHGPFQDAGIPAVSIFSSGGRHHGYHTPEDTIYHITPKIMETIGRISLLAAFEMANEGVAPAPAPAAQ